VFQSGNQTTSMSEGAVCDGGSMAAALEPDVDPTQVVGIEVELDALAAERAIDLELEAGQGDLGSAADGAD